MAASLHIRFATLIGNGAIILTFTHPLHGPIQAFIEHANGQPTGASVYPGGVQAPLKVLGSDYAEAVLDMASWALARDAA